MIKRIIGVDPGSERSGMVVLDNDSVIVGLNVANVAQVYDKISNYSLNCDLTVVVEDIKPYSLRLTPQVIDTCKFIGELVYRLRNEAGMNVVMIGRNEVKKWVFDAFPDISNMIVTKKIDKALFEACSIETREISRVDNNGKKARKASFVYVDDKVVTEAMKYLYKIPTPEPGSGYKFGLKDHSWQALGLASYYSSKFPLT